MGENGAAHDGKVCIGAYKIVGKLLYKIKQLLERAAIDFHRRVPAIKHDTVLVIVAIGRILQEPGAAAHFQGNDPVVLPCRVIDPSGVALVLLAQLALGVSALLHLQGSRNGLGVLLRLGQIDGHIHIAVRGGSDPLSVFGQSVRTNVIGGLAKGIVIICGCLGALCVQIPKSADHRRGSRGQQTHQLGVKQIPVHHRVLAQPICASIVQQRV